MPRYGKRSKERLKGVNAKLVNVLNELIKIMDVTIIEGLRSAERQEELLKKILDLEKKIEEKGKATSAQQNQLNKAYQESFKAQSAS